MGNFAVQRNSKRQAFPLARRDKSSALSLAALYFLIIAVGSSLVIGLLGLDGLRTLLFFVFITTLGLWLCERTRRVSLDPKLRYLSYFWLCKILLTFILLFVGWMPELEPGASSSWGYDPQRYYLHAKQLIDYNWEISWLSLNYTGIVYYYSALFYLVGHNPVAPVVLNSFVTLVGVLGIVRFAYSSLPPPRRASKAWTLSFLLLVPELLWFDVMTSRETLTAVLLILATLFVGAKFSGAQFGRSISPVIFLFYGSVLIVAVLAVRTPMILAILLVLVLYFFALRRNSSSGLVTRLVLLGSLGVAVIFGTQIQTLIGGYEFDLAGLAARVTAADENVVLTRQWASQSIGLLLVPDGFLQSILFLLPRMVLYLAAPLPNIDVSVAALIGGSWSEWQRLMTIATSSLMLLGFPYVLSGTWHAWQIRRTFPAMLIVPLAFWGVFIVVAGGNYIIHARYRVMFSALLFAVMWLGYVYCRRVEVGRWAFYWYSLLGSAAVFYLIYKWAV